MKENYISRINKLGKYAGVVVNVLKGLVILGIVVVVLLYLLLDSAGKAVSGFYLKDDLYLEIDLRDFGFIYSEVDRAEQAEYGKVEWKPYEIAKESFGDSTSKGLKIQLLEAYTTTFMYTEDLTQVTCVSVRNMDIFLIVVLVYLILIFVTLVFVRRFFKALQKEHSPFGKYVISNMQKIAFSLIPWGLIGPVMEAEGTKTASKISVLAGMNIVTIFVIIILLCLVYVFKYGALLQQESDETL